MIVYHDKSLNVTGTITIHPDGYDPAINGEPFVIHPEIIPHERIHLRRDARGVVRAHRKREMDLIQSAGSARIGQAITITGIPKGAAISANGSPLGTMDESEALEFEPATTGIFDLRIECDGYLHEEVRIEIVGGD